MGVWSGSPGPRGFRLTYLLGEGIKSKQFVEKCQKKSSQKVVKRLENGGS